MDYLTLRIMQENLLELTKENEQRLKDISKSDKLVDPFIGLYEQEAEARTLYIIEYAKKVRDFTKEKETTLLLMLPKEEYEDELKRMVELVKGLETIYSKWKAKGEENK